MGVEGGGSVAEGRENGILISETRFCSFSSTNLRNRVSKLERDSGAFTLCFHILKSSVGDRCVEFSVWLTVRGLRM